MPKLVRVAKTKPYDTHFVRIGLTALLERFMRRYPSKPLPMKRLISEFGVTAPGIKYRTQQIEKRDSLPKRPHGGVRIRFPEISQIIREQYHRAQAGSAIDLFDLMKIIAKTGKVVSFEFVRKEIKELERKHGKNITATTNGLPARANIGVISAALREHSIIASRIIKEPYQRTRQRPKL